MSQDIQIRSWVSRGETLMVNTSALDIDDPDHVYNQITAQGKRPEDYGIYHPWAEEFLGMDRNALIREIVDLRKELIAMHRASAAGWI